MSEQKTSFKSGPLFIMLGASLWAIDAIFRTQLTFTIPSASIVFLEHLIGFLILSPVFIKNWSSIKKLQVGDWGNFLAMTIVSSVLGGILFTQALGKSFAQFDFITPILLLKLQPVFVVALSAIFLKEKITPRFLFLALIALIGSYLMSFGLTMVQFFLAGKELVVALALGATLCWGAGTIMSKKALKKLTFPAATSLRFLLAIPVALVFSYLLNQTYDFTKLGADQVWRFLVIAGITGGVASLMLYYKGLQKTEAKISTFAELIFPVISIIIGITALNPYGEPQVLSTANIIGIVVLLVSVFLITRDRQA